MTSSSALLSTPAGIVRHKQRVTAIREEARRRFSGGATGGQVAGYLSEAIDELLREFMEEAVSELPAGQRSRVRERGAVVAVGGTGRGELAPYSDIDLMFLDAGGSDSEFRDAATRMVQLCWDAKLDLGHSVRTVRDCIHIACQEADVTTALVEARCLWGNEELFTTLVEKFRTRVVRGRLRAFIDDCIAARANDWDEEAPTALELEPDIKKSLGGLRDLHLIRWIGYGLCGQRDLESLRLRGLLEQEDARRLRRAQEHLTRLRINLHLSAGKAHDVLTRDEQLRITEEWGVSGTAAHKPVEQFMREHFRHSSAVAGISRRFVALHRRRSWVRRFLDIAATHHADGVLLVRPQEIEVRPHHLPRVCRDVESMLRLYQAVALYGKLPSVRVTRAIEAALPQQPDPLSEPAARCFRAILACQESLGPTLRSMFECHLLDHVVPDITDARCLLQFNQYHSYTVDEHTLRALETIVRFETDEEPVGTAYRRVKSKEVLHLALLLHDLGKGRGGDHSGIGRRIAEGIATRLFLSEEQRDQLMFLVHKHLVMADLALRRDFTDPRLLVKFAHDVGTAETLRMLYVLTVADITAVGPGTFTSWKGELLADLFDRAMMIVTGRHYSYLEQERLAAIRKRVRASIVPVDPHLDERSWDRWIDRQLDAFSPYYLTCTRPERIASDLDVIQHLPPGEIRINSHYEPESGSVEYRIITQDKPECGIFHRITGVLTAKRMDILSADISTTHAGVAIDSFRVLDRDFTGEVPLTRMNDVARALTDVLTNEVSIESLFQRNSRFGAGEDSGPVSDLPLRIRIDNDTSDTRTVIDVFAHDRPGLLYTIARTLHELRVSVDLAKIGTHFDQVVDVLYVTDLAGRKLTDPTRLQEIRRTLEDQLAAFECDGCRAFLSATSTL